MTVAFDEPSGAADEPPDGPPLADERAAEIPLEQIVDDPAHSPRLALAAARVREFAGLIQEQGVTPFPPVVLAGPRGDGTYAVIDGRHRIAAARAAGAASFPAILFPWTSGRELFAAALRLSARSGLPLTNREKRRAVRRLLHEFPERSTRELAEMAATSHALVARCKKEGAAPAGQENNADARHRPEPHARKLLAAAAALGQALREPGDAQEAALALAGAARRQYAKAEAAAVLADLAAWFAAALALLGAAPADAAVNG